MSHPVDLHVGKVLADRRRALGLSQSEVARSVGITFQQLQKYERGVNRVSASRLFDICQVLALPVAAAFPAPRVVMNRANDPPSIRDQAKAG